jgi:hypothetical protein
MSWKCFITKPLILKTAACQPWFLYHDIMAVTGAIYNDEENFENGAINRNALRLNGVKGLRMLP